MTYIPGVCNVARAGRRKRLLIFIGFAAISALAYILMPSFRILVAAPMFISATALLEYAFNFCAYLGIRGMHEDEKGMHYTNERYRAADRRKAWKIIIAAAVMSAIVTAMIL